MENDINKGKRRPTAIDLFSGAGGLTVGLKKAGFRVVGAVEIESAASATYAANHPEVHAINEDIKKITSRQLLDLTSDGVIDLIAGCPPCQGFSSLTAKHMRNDPRNELIKEMVRIISEIRPLAVMMENVPGLYNRGRHLLNDCFSEMEKVGYKISFDVLQVADFGVPQNRKRLVVLAGLGFDIPVPESTHSKNGENGLIRWKSVGDAIRGLPTPVTFDVAIKQGGPNRYNWHVVRTMSPINKLRIKHVKPGETRAHLPEELRPRCHKGHDHGFANFYGRLSWDQPSSTITGGCTTLSKGRFGHPEQDRTISVRESALLQTFPPDYFFNTMHMDKVCNMIGNALPCTFAEALAKHVHKFMSLNNGQFPKTN